MKKENSSTVIHWQEMASFDLLVERVGFENIRFTNPCLSGYRQIMEAQERERGNRKLFSIPSFSLPVSVTRKIIFRGTETERQRAGNWYPEKYRNFN